MRNGRTYDGLTPVMVSGSHRATLYLVSSSAGEILPGDLVSYSSINQGAVAPYLASSQRVAGAALSRVGANEGSTSADPRVASSQTVLVCDDPESLFTICDSSSGIIGALTNAIGSLVDVLSSGVIGASTSKVNRSIQAMSGVTATSGITDISAGGGSVTLPLVIVGLHPVESAYSTVAAATASTDIRRWVVKLNRGAGQGAAFPEVTT